MKMPLGFVCLLVSGSLYAGAAMIEKNFTTEQVVEALGKPLGTIELKDKTLFLYPQGEVTVKAGLVSDFDLMETEAYLAEQERRRIEREEWQAAQERRAAQRRKEGQALKAEKIESSAFAGLPAKDRVDFWRRFQERFPSVDSSDQLATALQDHQSEMAELRSRERISDLETRVAQAEREAAAARLETERLREETERLRSSQSRQGYGLRLSTHPVRVRPYYYRPSTVTIHSTGSTSRTTQTQSSRNFHFRHNSDKYSRGPSVTGPLGIQVSK